MKRFSLSACCLSTLLFAGVGLACDYPDNPNLPNGSSASKEEMIAGQKAVNAYIKDLEAYQQCLVDEEEAARAEMGELEPEALKQREEMLTKKYNAAHDEMLKAAAAFNAELEEFQSREE